MGWQKVLEGEALTTPTVLLQDSILAAIKRRARMEYGDYAEPVVEDHVLDGTLRNIDLADDVIEPAGLIVTLNGVNLVVGIDFTLDARGGRIILASLPAAGATLSVTGTNYQFYTDEELNDFMHSATLKHTNQRVVSGRSIDTSGFIAYSQMQQTLVTLPEVEYHPVAVMTAIEALWALAGDAAYDIDVNTADGTSLPRMQRYQAIMNQITTLTDRYKELCFAIGNVGFWRIHDGGRLRRVSLFTGRLIPLRAPRELDDAAYPARIITPRDVPVGTLTTGSPIPAPELNPTAIAGNVWSTTITVPNVDLTLPGTLVAASISAGVRASALVPIIATVVDATHVSLSLTAVATTALPPYAPWRVMVTYPDGHSLPAVTGTFLVEYPS